MDRSAFVAAVAAALAGDDEALGEIVAEGDGVDFDTAVVARDTLFFAGTPATTLNLSHHLSRDAIALGADLLKIYEHFGYLPARQNRQPADWLPYLLALWVQLERDAPAGENSRQLADRYIGPGLTRLIEALEKNTETDGSGFWADILRRVSRTVQ